MHLLPATSDDRSFLAEALATAAFPPGTPRPAEPLADDHVARYLDGWAGDGPAPAPGEVGLVAWEGDEQVGASWTRLLPPERAGYGFVAPEVPELTVAVVPGHRGRGAGRALVAGVLDLAAARGCSRVSLSVAGTNPRAAALYRDLGFAEEAVDDGGSLTMVAASAPGAPPDGDAPVEARAATTADGPALARLREVMLVADGKGGASGWVGPFLRRWAADAPPGRLLGAVVDDARGRPIASAIAELTTGLPGPGQEDGRLAYVSSVATEDPWRRRGAAGACLRLLLDRIDGLGVEVTRLAASPEGEPLYVGLGFVRSHHPAMRRPRPS